MCERWIYRTRTSPLFGLCSWRQRTKYLTHPGLKTEWERFDLLVQVSDDLTIIEFKYYLLRQTFDLQGKMRGYKGGAGPKNEAEFRDCLHKLRTTVVSREVGRYLVLVYQRDYVHNSRCSFPRSYGELSKDKNIAEVWPLVVVLSRRESLACGHHCRYPSGRSGAGDPTEAVDAASGCARGRR